MLTSYRTLMGAGAKGTPNELLGENIFYIGYNAAPDQYRTEGQSLSGAFPAGTNGALLIAHTTHEAAANSSVWRTTSGSGTAEMADTATLLAEAIAENRFRTQIWAFEGFSGGLPDGFLLDAGNSGDGGIQTVANALYFKNFDSSLISTWASGADTQHRNGVNTLSKLEGTSMDSSFLGKRGRMVVASGRGNQCSNIADGGNASWWVHGSGYIAFNASIANVYESDTCTFRADNITETNPLLSYTCSGSSNAYRASAAVGF